MTGTFVSFIKAGRVFVPVEILFSNAVLNEATGDKTITSKWADDSHFEEIKETLKSAVELALKHNNDIAVDSSKGITSVISSVPQIVRKTLTTFGYVYELNNGRFSDMVYLKNSWRYDGSSTDDDDENENDDDTDNVDGDTGLMDYGGRFKTYRPTEVYIKVCAIPRSTNSQDDEKKIYRELGIKDSRLETFFTKKT